MDGEAEIDPGGIVPGDILILSEGDKVPADGRITEAFGLKVDESVLTGESVSADKSNREVPQETILAEKTNMVYSGTYVTRGNATVAVTATGMSTEIGKIATDLYEITEQPTSFQTGGCKAWQTDYRSYCCNCSGHSYNLLFF